MLKLTPKLEIDRSGALATSPELSDRTFYYEARVARRDAGAAYPPYCLLHSAISAPAPQVSHRAMPCLPGFSHCMKLIARVDLRADRSLRRAREVAATSPRSRRGYRAAARCAAKTEEQRTYANANAMTQQPTRTARRTGFLAGAVAWTRACSASTNMIGACVGGF